LEVKKGFLESYEKFAMAAPGLNDPTLEQHLQKQTSQLLRSEKKDLETVFLLLGPKRAVQYSLKDACIVKDYTHYTMDPSIPEHMYIDLKATIDRKNLFIYGPEG
jgi:hypothetical protein